VILLLVAPFWTASPAHATPLLWIIAGATNPSSTFNRQEIGNLPFVLRIFLDTEVKVIPFLDPPPDPSNLPNDLPFLGQYTTEVAFFGAPNLVPSTPLDLFAHSIEYYLTGDDLVQGVQLFQSQFPEDVGGKQLVSFAPIAADLDPVFTPLPPDHFAGTRRVAPLVSNATSAIHDQYGPTPSRFIRSSFDPQNRRSTAHGSRRRTLGVTLHHRSDAQGVADGRPASLSCEGT